MRRSRIAGANGVHAGSTMDTSTDGIYRHNLVYKWRSVAIKALPFLTNDLGDSQISQRTIHLGAKFSRHFHYSESTGQREVRPLDLRHQLDAPSGYYIANLTL